MVIGKKMAARVLAIIDSEGIRGTLLNLHVSDIDPSSDEIL